MGFEVICTSLLIYLSIIKLLYFFSGSWCLVSNMDLYVEVITELQVAKENMKAVQLLTLLCCTRIRSTIVSALIYLRLKYN